MFRSRSCRDYSSDSFRVGDIAERVRVGGDDAGTTGKPSTAAVHGPSFAHSAPITVYDTSPSRYLFMRDTWQTSRFTFTQPRPTCADVSIYTILHLRVFSSSITRPPPPQSTRACSMGGLKKGSGFEVSFDRIKRFSPHSRFVIPHLAGLVFIVAD